MFGLFARRDKTQNAIDSAACRREADDRRQNHTKALVFSLFKRRRRGPRREDDHGMAQYVDVHEPAVIGLALGILFLCVTDAFFTLNIISLGGEEVNPFMRVLLETNVTMFFFVKFFITAFGLVFTVAHKHFKIFQTISGYHILYGVFIGYAILIYYELVLLKFDPKVFGL